ncbi:hypothetical protein [Pelagerythrobacter sp.]|uniref:hypothetical protein n=1 Tax=Pelagerythrobacter sp. TaxID=2800702 RepID=UPI0035B1DC00
MTALFSRIWPHLAVVALVIGAIWWIDHRGYQRAQGDAKFERTVTALLIEKRAGQLEAELTDRLAERDRVLVDRLASLDGIERTVIQPVIREELANAPHLSDPAAGYGERLRDAINDAIRQSAGPAAPVRDDR